jgi:predicted polyphosphate/ATP-dependent NAD kinase
MRNNVVIVAAASTMGGDLAQAHSFATEVVDRDAEETTPEDTRAAARAMAERHVDLILYAGGDGTTRDIVDAIGTTVPIIGIPTGVKMHSATFATTPEAAADVAAAHLGAAAPRCRDAEVLDVDEHALREGIVSSRLYAVACVPEDDGRRVQAPKARSLPGTPALDALCRAIAAECEGLVIFGPGTTTQRVLAHLGHDGTLLGVDAVDGGAVVGRDLTEEQLLELLEDRRARLVVGVVGGQGALFGRGNQQLSPAVLRRIGLDRIDVVGAEEKLLSLDPAALRVDTGDPALDAELAGFRRVRVAPNRFLVLTVSS